MPDAAGRLEELRREAEAAVRSASSVSTAPLTRLAAPPTVPRCSGGSSPIPRRTPVSSDLRPR